MSSKTEDTTETPEEIPFGELIGNVFKMTGTIPAPLLFREVSNRVTDPELKQAIDSVLEEANEGVKAAVEELKDHRIALLTDQEVTR